MGKQMKRLLAAVALAVPLLANMQMSAQGGAKPIFAQKLVDETVTAHPELRLLGLHSVPPGTEQSQIIANNFKEKVGKKSDPDDIDVQKTGQPECEPKNDRNVWDIGYPLRDQKGTIIGTAVLELKYSAQKTKEGALKQAGKILKEMQNQLPSKDKLFEPI